ncbi:MAG: VOC family protein [Candidatus Nanohaloarchaea archaeon]
MEAERIDHVNIRIPESGVEKALEFYRDRLGFELVKLEKYRNGERTSFAFRMGDTSMLHVRPKEDFERPGKKNFDHFCVIVDEPRENVRELFEEEEILREGNPWGPGGRAPAVYVEDPFGYVIEFKEQP